MGLICVSLVLSHAKSRSPSRVARSGAFLNSTKMVISIGSNSMWRWWEKKKPAWAGATPLEKEAFLTSRFWNTANSLITGRFITPTPLAVVILLICVLSLLAGFVTAAWRPVSAVMAVLGAGLCYVLLARYFYISHRL